MKIKNRNYGLDLIKILVCILVIGLHSLPPTNVVVHNNICNMVLYFAGTLAIPIFLMTNSFFILNKKTISYNYVFKKVNNILFIIIGWIGLYSLIYLLIKQKFDFVNQVEGSMFNNIPSGFYHFWFFWALIVLILLAPILWWMLNKHFYMYLLLTAIMVAICLILDLCMHFGYTNLVRDTPQVFRFYTWITYYLLGGIIGNYHFKKIIKIFREHLWNLVLLDVVLYAVLIIYSIWNRRIIHWEFAEANYNNIIVIITSVLSVSLFAMGSFHYKRQIEFVIPTTMGIYILHPVLLSKINKLSIFVKNPVLLIPVLFIICLIIVKIGLKMPIVNRLFKL